MNHPNRNWRARSTRASEEIREVLARLGSADYTEIAGILIEYQTEILRAVESHD